MEKKSAGTSSLRRVVGRIARALAVTLLIVLLSGLVLWASLAVCFADLSGAPPRRVLAGIFLAACVAAACLMRPLRFGMVANVVLVAVVLAWFFSIKPSNDRAWAADVAVLPSVELDGSRFTVHGLRNFDYRSETDFTPRWEDRSYDLDEVESCDFALCYWGSKSIAHGIVSFGFDDGRHLAISIETRKEKSESYSAVEGFFRQYELTYVVADERDVLRVRTNYRNEDVYLYRTRLSRAETRAVLQSYIERINSLHGRPEFYNALTTNCVTSVVPHAQAGRPSAHVGWDVLLSGHAARQAYRNGNLDESIPFQELEKRSRINDMAMAADKDLAFSTRIRTGLPVPAKVGARVEPTAAAVGRP